MGVDVVTGGASGPATLYCIVPPELAPIRDEIVRSLPEGPPFEVLVERRSRERRTGTERRREGRHPPAGIERRLAHDLEGRRFAERRALLIPVDTRPPLSPEVRRYSDRLRFVRRDEPRRRMHESERVHALAARWREHAREARHEAMVNLIRGRTEGREALAAALATRDAYTWEHSVAVVWLALECAREIGLSEDAVVELHDVALLHDIGKLAVPDAILTKPGRLSEAEWDVMRRHPVVGAELLGGVETLRHLAPTVRAEHERWDGRGYPDGLAGEQIPVASRIVLACDAYHAMVSRRPYREPLTSRAARAELATNMGTQFWPEAAKALLSVLERTAPRDRSQIAVSRWPGSEPVREDPGTRSRRAPGQEGGSERDRVRSSPHHEGSAWRAAFEERDALRRALESVLETTHRRHGYPPRAFLARVRAERILRRLDLRDRED
jgi:putative nucleotidyltransferase with HDIG domain